MVIEELKNKSEWDEWIGHVSRLLNTIDNQQSGKPKENTSPADKAEVKTEFGEDEWAM